MNQDKLKTFNQKQESNVTAYSYRSKDNLTFRPFTLTASVQ